MTPNELATAPRRDADGSGDDDLAGALVDALARLDRTVSTDEVRRSLAAYDGDSSVDRVRSVATGFGLVVADGGAATDRSTTVDVDGHRLLLSPSASFLADEEELGTRGTLGRRLRVVRSGYVLSILAGAALTVPGLVVAGLARTFVDRYLIGGSDDWLPVVFLGLAAALVVQVVLGGVQNLTLNRLSRKMAIHMMAESMWHTMRLPIRYFVSRPAGDTAYAIALNDRISWQLGGQLSYAAMGGVIAIVYGAFLLRYDVLLTAVTLTLTVASIITVRWSSKRLRPLNREMVEAQAATSGTAASGISAIESLKANGAENDLFRRFIARYESVLTIDQRRTKKGHDRLGAAGPVQRAHRRRGHLPRRGAGAGRPAHARVARRLPGAPLRVPELGAAPGSHRRRVPEPRRPVPPARSAAARTDRVRRRRPGCGTRRPRDGQAAVGAARGPQPALRLRRRRPADRRPLVHRRTRPPGRARGRQRQRQVDRGPPRDRPARPVGRAGPARRRPSAPRAGQRPRPLGRVRAAGDPAVRGHGERQRHHVGPHGPGGGDRASRTGRVDPGST